MGCDCAYPLGDGPNLACECRDLADFARSEVHRALAERGCVACDSIAPGLCRACVKGVRAEMEAEFRDTLTQLRGEVEGLPRFGVAGEVIDREDALALIDKAIKGGG